LTADALGVVQVLWAAHDLRGPRFGPPDIHVDVDRGDLACRAGQVREQRGVVTR